MTRFHLLAAVLVISVATAHADPLVRTSAAQPAPTPGYVVPAGTIAYQDYPPYPLGFSSYQGLGFMGFCCEPISPCALHAWDGYCEEKACCEREQGPSFCEKLQAWPCRPAGTCCPQSCEPCGGSWAQVRPSDCEGKLPRLRGSRACILRGCRGGTESCGKGSEPTAAKESEAVKAFLEPPTPEPATPEVASGVIPNLPAPPAPERSASRADLRRLPSVKAGCSF